MVDLLTKIRTNSFLGNTVFSFYSKNSLLISKKHTQKTPSEEAKKMTIPRVGAVIKTYGSADEAVKELWRKFRFNLNYKNDKLKYLKEYKSNILTPEGCKKILPNKQSAKISDFFRLWTQKLNELIYYYEKQAAQSLPVIAPPRQHSDCIRNGNEINGIKHTVKDLTKKVTSLDATVKTQRDLLNRMNAKTSFGSNLSYELEMMKKKYGDSINNLNQKIEEFEDKFDSSEYVSNERFESLEQKYKQYNTE
ncbi:hypothetical protein ACFLZV_07395, partial [Candidatus Margulisiibacteriota bacterium]